jgi:hypothetical protein
MAYGHGSNIGIPHGGHTVGHCWTQEMRPLFIGPQNIGAFKTEHASNICRQFTSPSDNANPCQSRINTTAFSSQVDISCGNHLPHNYMNGRGYYSQCTKTILSPFVQGANFASVRTLPNSSPIMPWAGYLPPFWPSTWQRD